MFARGASRRRLRGVRRFPLIHALGGIAPPGANPDHIRLDGERTGGSLEVAGRFRHQGRVWVVHADTHYRPLMLAYAASEQGADPFVEEDTPRGQCLALTTELRAQQQSPHKHLHIYSW